MIVLSLWAIVIIVDCLNSSAIKVWIFCSVTTSIFAVASSRITTFEDLRIALQMHISCLSPEDRFWPFSVNSVSSPLSSLFSRSSSDAFFNTSRILSSEQVLSGSRLKRRVPVNIVGSWGITVMLARRSFRSSLLMSSPSITMEPPTISTIRLRLRQMVDLPAPVLPTTPTFSPGRALKVSWSRTTSVVGLYFKTTSLNSTSPLCGHPGAVLFPSIRS